jgi:uncharacterized protein (DUF2062 family)
MFERIGQWWASNAPTRESLEQIGWLRPFAHRIFEPSLWRFTRRSVPRGVALGVLVGVLVMIPGLQVIAAVLLALPCRANVPIAVGMTFLSNPATAPFILYFSLLVGHRFLHSTAGLERMAAMVSEGAGVAEWAAWAASSAAPALVAGLLVVAVISASVGYLLASFLWRAWVLRKWRLRARRNHLR